MAKVAEITAPRNIGVLLDIVTEAAKAAKDTFVAVRKRAMQIKKYSTFNEEKEAADAVVIASEQAKMASEVARKQAPTIVRLAISSALDVEKRVVEALSQAHITM